jgi:ABC-type multidrug transport system ATPase subunit
VKKAVDGLDLTMYTGHITALLGHNGAGTSPSLVTVT